MDDRAKAIAALEKAGYVPSFTEDEAKIATFMEYKDTNKLPGRIPNVARIMNGDDVFTFELTVPASDVPSLLSPSLTLEDVEKEVRAVIAVLNTKLFYGGDRITEGHLTALLDRLRKRMEG